MRAVELGAKYYMVKPFEIQTLVARIREVVGHTGSQPEIVHLGTLQRSQSLDEKLSSPVPDHWYSGTYQGLPVPA